MTRPYFIVVLAATLGVWSVVLVNAYGRRSGQPRTADRLDPAARASAARAVIVLAWAFGLFPALLALLENGRHGSEFSTTTLVLTHAPARLATVISSLLIFTCCRYLLIYSHVPSAASLGRVAAFISPWLAIQVFAAANAGYVSGRQVIFYPLIALTLWLISPPIEVAVTVGVLAALTAALSLVLGLFSSLGLVNAGSAGMVKAIVGHGSFLLAGPYSSSNSLALSLALGVPCAMLIRSMRARIVAVALIACALAWTAGRTSILAAVVGLAAWALIRAAGTYGKTVGLAVAGAGIGLMFWTPLHEKDPFAFTYRGTIWIQSLHTWRTSHFWLGGGPQYFERSDLAFPPLTLKVVHGHNLLVDCLVRGGLVAAVALGVWLIVLVGQAARFSRITAFPLAFMTTLLFVSWLEVPLNLNNLGYVGYACWLPLAVICFGRGLLTPEPVAGSAQARLGPSPVTVRA